MKTLRTGLFAMLACAAIVWATGAAEAATLTGLKGTVTVKAKGETAAKPGKNNMVLAEGAVIQTAGGSSAIVRFEDGSMLKVGPMSKMTISKTGSGGGKATSLDVGSGKVWARVEKLGSENTFEIKTPTAIAGVRGTYYSSEVDEDQTSRFDVFDGEVAVTSLSAPGEEVIVKANQTTSVAQGKAPQAPQALPKDGAGKDGFTESEFKAAVFDIVIGIEPDAIVVGGKAMVNIQVLKNGEPLNMEVPLHLKSNGAAVFPNGKTETDIVTTDQGTATVELSGTAEETVSIEASIMLKIKKEKAE
jgi:hypothetical protein